MFLRPGINSDDLDKIVRNDFEIDAGIAKEIDTNKLFDGLFALANLWVPTIEESDYVSFFVMLSLMINDSNT
jgi:hypothetical protein